MFRIPGKLNREIQKRQHGSEDAWRNISRIINEQGVSDKREHAGVDNKAMVSNLGYKRRAKDGG